MKSRQGKSKPLPKEKRLEIASFVVKHQDLTISQIAASFGVKRQMVYKIVGEFLDVKREYAFKSLTEPAERGSD